MWADQKLEDAMRVLTGASGVQKVSTDTSTYVVANEIPYTDELYLDALEELLRNGSLMLKETIGEREFYQGVAH